MSKDSAVIQKDKENGAYFLKVFQIKYTKYNLKQSSKQSVLIVALHLDI